MDAIDAAIINPDGFTRGYAALVTAISRAKVPTIECTSPIRRGMHSDVLTASQAESPGSASWATIWPGAD